MRTKFACHCVHLGRSWLCNSLAIQRTLNLELVLVDALTVLKNCFDVLNMPHTIRHHVVHSCTSDSGHVIEPAVRSNNQFTEQYVTQIAE